MTLTRRQWFAIASVLCAACGIFFLLVAVGFLIYKPRPMSGIDIVVLYTPTATSVSPALLDIYLSPTPTETATSTLIPTLTRTITPTLGSKTVTRTPTVKAIVATATRAPTAKPTATTKPTVAYSAPSTSSGSGSGVT